MQEEKVRKKMEKIKSMEAVFLIVVFERKKLNTIRGFASLLPGGEYSVVRYSKKR